MQRRCVVSMVKDAIRKDARSLSQLARDAGVAQSQLSRFLAGHRGVSLETASRLMGTLGLTVHAQRRAA